jgi:hypothetical protein
MKAGLMNDVTHRIPDLSGVSEHLLVKFPVQRLGSARLLWVNERWFLDGGINLHNPEVRREIERELIDRFGVAASTSVEAPCSSSLNVRHLRADRYGGSLGTLHGGSGRCGIDGLYNAKGIGRTPLVPDGVDWLHGSGFMLLSDAIREAVAAEIVDEELPHGAVPVVAIIDAGITMQPERGGRDERCGIAVRPNFVRPAHFERSIYFGRGGPESEQYKDALRTRDLVAFATGDPTLREAANFDFTDLRSMFLRFARQIGAARALRLWQGPFSTGNMSIDGRVVDFGAFRAVPSWRKAAAWGYGVEFFGLDMTRLGHAVDSLGFYFRKYGRAGAEIRDGRRLKREILVRLNESFLFSCKEALGLSGEVVERMGDEFDEYFSRYYAFQQREKIYINRPASFWRRPWLFDGLRREDAVQGRELEFVRQFRDLLRRAESDSGPSSFVGRVRTALRWLRPRPLLYMEVDYPRANRFVRRLTGDTATDQGMVARYINDAVTKSRRYWPGVDANCDVLGQVSDVASSVLYCRLPGDRQPHARVECRAVGDEAYVLGQAVALSEIRDEFSPERDGAVVRFRVPLVSSAWVSGYQATLSGGSWSLQLPRPTMSF